MFLWGYWWSVDFENKRVSFLTEIFWCGFLCLHIIKNNYILFKYSELDETFMIWYGTSVDINENKSTLKLKYFHLLVFSNLLIIYQKKMFYNRLKSYKLQKHSNSRLPDSLLTLKPIAQLRENYKTNLDFID